MSESPRTHTTRTGTGGSPIMAEWWQRLVARILDGVLFSVVATILTFALAAILGSAVLPGLVAYVLAGAAYAGYDYLTQVATGQTLGKRLMGIRVTGLGGQPMTPAQIRTRVLIYPGLMALLGVPVVNLAAGLFMAVTGAFIFTDQTAGQCLHDKLAGTIVVKV